MFPLSKRGVPLSRIVDCFLYNHQQPYRDLLAIRLSLLGNIVDRFVIVCSRFDFSGRVVDVVFPVDDEAVRLCKDRIELVTVDTLPSKSARKNEQYSRDMIRRGIADLEPDDLVMISDVDEIPRPSVVSDLCGTFDSDGALVLVLGMDYFNFKFNYKLIHGLQGVWAGTTVTRYANLSTPQQIREARWSKLEQSGGFVLNAGWHFSHLSRDTPDLLTKLDSMFSSHDREGTALRMTRAEAGGLH